MLLKLITKRFRSCTYFTAIAAIFAIFAASPATAQVTFAQFNQTDGSIQQWSITEGTASGITTTTISASGAVDFTFGFLPGLPFTGGEPSTFTFSASTTQSGQCNTSTCANGNSFDQAGYSGMFSFIDAGSNPGSNLLSGTFATTGNPSQTGGSFGSQVGAHVGTFGAATDSTNPAQVTFTSDYLSFAGSGSETASFSLSSLKDALATNNYFVTTATTNSQAYPSQTFGAAGAGTFSSEQAPTGAPEPATLALIGVGLIGLGVARRFLRPAESASRA